MNTQNKLIRLDSGQPQFGVHQDTISEINWQDFNYHSHMDKKHGRIKKWMDFNQFQFIGLSNPELMMGLAIVDIKISTLAFVYIYEPKTQTYFEDSIIGLPWKAKIEPYPESGKAWFKNSKLNIEIDSSNQGVRHVRLKSKTINLDACIQIDEDYEPLRVCARAGYKGWVFTQKSPALTCTGQLEFSGKTLDLGELNTLACVDWSAGFMRRHTFWNWISISSFLPDGRRLGLNLAAGVNETGYTENALWLDGKLIKLDMARFEFDRFDENSPWRIHTSDGVIDLTFKPLGKREEKRNFIISASNFRQYFGLFSGNIKTDKEQINIENIYGLCEDHYAKW